MSAVAHNVRTITAAAAGRPLCQCDCATRPPCRPSPAGDAWADVGLGPTPGVAKRLAKAIRRCRFERQLKSKQHARAPADLAQTPTRSELRSLGAAGRRAAPMNLASAEPVDMAGCSPEAARCRGGKRGAVV